jgi:hypothetical protein
MTRVADATDVRALLAGVVPATAVADDAATRRLYAQDIFHHGTPPLAIVTPLSGAEAASAARALAAGGVRIAARGGATGYTAGCVLDGEWVCLDMRRMNRILAIDTTDLHVTVEAGCTWATLAEALARDGLRTPCWGPSSGRHATIGGSLSQHAVFHGSAAHGTTAENVLGLTILLPDGTIVTTGSAALRGVGPFFRASGPDLTGPFLGDCGVFGIKLTATLRLMPLPARTRFAGFAFGAEHQAIDAMGRIAREGLASDCMILDPAAASRLQDAAPTSEMLPGHHVAPGIGWLLSFAVEGRSDIDADDALAAAAVFATKAGGSPAGQGVYPLMRAAPFGPLTMLGMADGRRWIPVHGIVPHSRHREALDAVRATVERHAALIRDQEISWSCASLAIWRGAILVEPGLIWRGTANPIADGFLAEAGMTATPTGSSQDEQGIALLRKALATALADAGAVNIQVGRSYPFTSRMESGFDTLLGRFRTAVDADNRSNPGALSG